jgi:predicted transcriptional regulator
MQEELEFLLIDTLRMPHIESKLIILLAAEGELSSKEIAQRLDIQQPVVSRTTAKMVDESILVKHQGANEGKRGRRAFLYSLAAQPVAALNRFLKPKIDQMREQERAVQQALLKIRKK